MKSRHDLPSINTKRADGIKPGGKPYHVLVVDDQEFHRKQVRQILESEQYKIIGEASDGEEALAIYNKMSHQIDLIVTDLDMPKLDGYALLYQLKNKNTQAKIVFISDETTKGVLQDLLKMGASDFILKPLQRAVVLERIRLVLQKK